MASESLSARLRYLNDSAHLLATTAPTTSKYLMSKFNSLMFDNDIDQPESHRRSACGACGSVMILGWDGKLEAEPKRARRGKSTQRKATTHRARTMVYKCDSCGRKTRLNIDIDISSLTSKRKALSLSIKKHSSGITQASNTLLLPGSSIPPQSQSNISSTPSSTSKKRTKARNKGGLEAILARQRATDSRVSSGFGLDLLDFMKKT